MEPHFKSQSKPPLSHVRAMRVDNREGRVVLTFTLDEGQRMSFALRPEVALLDGLVTATMGRDLLAGGGHGPESRRQLCERLIGSRCAFPSHSSPRAITVTRGIGN